MEDIEKMAEACMKDIDDDEDDSLEDDEDLLVNETCDLLSVSFQCQHLLNAV